MLNKEELLKSRFKVVADYPGNPFYVGEILYIFDTIEECESFNTRAGHTPRLNDLKQWEKYPALFQPLPWWAERDEKDMPEYINQDGVIYKIKDWSEVFSCPYVFIIDRVHEGYIKECGYTPLYGEFLPSNETEYNQFINQKKQ